MRERISDLLCRKKCLRLGMGGKTGRIMVFPFFFVLSTMVFSGCASEEEYIQQAARIIDDEDYINYMDLEEKGELDVNGRYLSTVEEKEETENDQNGSVHITFARNSHLDIVYYRDSMRTDQILSDEDYFEPGSSVYTAVPVCDSSISSAYHFVDFHIYEYSENGQRQKLFWEWEEEASGFVLHIPKDCGEADISIEPVGGFDERELVLSDYWDSAGKPQELSGTWIVNEEDTMGDTIEVNPLVALKVEYRYDPEEYAYVASEPGSYYHENGKVIFETVDASSNVEGFSVQLRPLAGKSRFIFDPSEYVYEHGTVSFWHQGQEIKVQQSLADGAVLQYKVTEVEEGYWVPEEEGMITINASVPEETKKQIKGIKFSKEAEVLVHLPQPVVGGSILYKVNGKTIEGSSCDVLAGTKIEMEFISWPGWITDSNLLDGIVYIVSNDEDGNGQLVHVDGVDIDLAFYEASDHKPVLNVVLKDGIMSETRFDIDASGIFEELQTTGLTYAGGNKTTVIPDWLGQKDRIIFSGVVGTEKGIGITANHDTIMPGDALRLAVEKVDDKGEKHISIRYMTKLPKKEVIDIYEDLADSTTNYIYKEITITISKVEVVTHEQKLIENGVLEITWEDVTEPSILENGDVTEDSRKVGITIKPMEGYYVTGSKVKEDVYHEVMKYSKWISDSEKILEKHPVKKYWSVTLDASNEYGNCIYKLDGKEVSGTIRIKEGQKLTLEYELTDTDYQIVRKKGLGSLFANIGSKNKESYSIEVSEELDGATISSEDYIEIERKEK